MSLNARVNETATRERMAISRRIKAASALITLECSVYSVRECHGLIYFKVSKFGHCARRVTLFNNPHRAHRRGLSTEGEVYKCILKDYYFRELGGTVNGVYGMFDVQCFH